MLARVVRIGGGRVARRTGAAVLAAPVASKSLAKPCQGRAGRPGGGRVSWAIHLGPWWRGRRLKVHC